MDDMSMKAMMRLRADSDARFEWISGHALSVAAVETRQQEQLDCLFGWTLPQQELRSRSAGADSL